MWGQLLSRLDGTKEQCNLFYLPGLTRNSKEQKVLFCYILAVLHFDCGGQPVHCFDMMVSRTLNSLMYFFLTFLSIMDVDYSSPIVPRLISDLLFAENTISFESCMIQLFIEHFFGWSEVFLLLTMAYDCYVALCKPLHFLVIMRQRVCVAILVVSCVGDFLHSIIQISTISGLPFCCPNIIDHFTCDRYPLLKLVCTDTCVIGILVVANGGLICSTVFLLLLISYGVILHSLKNTSQEERQKALQTCGSHITVAACFFVPCIFIYVRPATTFHIDKSLTVFYTIKTPMLKPLILRNSEMTNAMNQLWRKTKSD